MFVQHSETESHTGDDAAVVAVKEATTNTAATAAAAAADFDEEALLDETRVYSCAMQHFLICTKLHPCTPEDSMTLTHR